MSSNSILSLIHPIPLEINAFREQHEFLLRESLKANGVEVDTLKVKQISESILLNLQGIPSVEEMSDPLLRNINIFDRTVTMLTGKYRRIIVERAISHARKHSLYYLLFDIKNLSFFNDKVSHTFGNTVIISTFKILATHFPDVIWCRINGEGGDEFCALFEGSEEILNARYRLASQSLKIFSQKKIESLLTQEERARGRIKIPLTTTLAQAKSLKSTKKERQGFGVHMSYTKIRNTKTYTDTYEDVFSNVDMRLK